MLFLSHHAPFPHLALLLPLFHPRSRKTHTHALSMSTALFSLTSVLSLLHYFHHSVSLLSNDVPIYPQTLSLCLVEVEPFVTVPRRRPLSFCPCCSPEGNVTSPPLFTVVAGYLGNRKDLQYRATPSLLVLISHPVLFLSPVLSICVKSGSVDFPRKFNPALKEFSLIKLMTNGIFYGLKNIIHGSDFFIQVSVNFAAVSFYFTMYTIKASDRIMFFILLYLPLVSLLFTI